MLRSRRHHHPIPEFSLYPKWELPPYETLTPYFPPSAPGDHGCPFCLFNVDYPGRPIPFSHLGKLRLGEGVAEA